MTLIATLAPNNVPVLFGDLLVTGPQGPTEQEQRAVVVPAFGEVQDFFGDSGWGIRGLAQKVCILSNECAIAWSGSWLGARTAIAELRDRLASGTLSYDEIAACLNAEPELKLHPAAFVGLLYHEGELWQFHHGAETCGGQDSYGPTFYCGSGSNVYLDFMTLQRSARIRTDLEGATNDHSISHALSLGGMLLRAELEGGYAARTLREMFGGGYEVAYFSEGRMRKVEVTYVFWEARLGSNGIELSYPLLFIKQAYVGEHLLIRSARIDYAASFSREQVHEVDPMWSAPPQARPSPLEFRFESTRTCHCVVFKGSGGRTDVAIRVHMRNSESRPPDMFFHYNEAGELRGFHYTPEFAATLTASLAHSTGSL